MNSLLGLLNLVPRWVMAALIATLALTNCYTGVKLSSERSAHDKLKTAVAEQKAEATQTLLRLTEERLTAQNSLNALIAKTEKNRDNLQRQNTADLAARLAGERLQFSAECGKSSGGPESAASGATSDSSATVIQLPTKINDDLRRLAADAESVTIDYRVLYEYVHNPKLVCELQP